LRSADHLNFLYQPRQILRGSDHIYYAGGATKATASNNEPWDQLTVQGIRVGTITTLSDPTGNFLGNTVLGPACSTAVSSPNLPSPALSTALTLRRASPLANAFARLRIADALPNEGLQRRSRASPPTLATILEPGPISYSAADDALVHGDRHDVAMQILRATTRRRMFITSTGFLGLAHLATRLGDEVFVLMGADMPCVLRPLASEH
jgi:hypothetical protein